MLCINQLLYRNRKIHYNHFEVKGRTWKNDIHEVAQICGEIIIGRKRDSFVFCIYKNKTKLWWDTPLLSLSLGIIDLDWTE